SRWHRAPRQPIIADELAFHDTIPAPTRPAPTRRFAMMTLYYAPGACSMAAHIVLEESGEKYQPQQVDLAGGEQRTEAYLKLNPRGARARAGARHGGAVGGEHRHSALSRQAVRTVADRSGGRCKGAVADRLLRGERASRARPFRPARALRGRSVRLSHAQGN